MDSFLPMASLGGGGISRPLRRGWLCESRVPPCPWVVPHAGQGTLFASLEWVSGRGLSDHGVVTAM